MTTSTIRVALDTFQQAANRGTAVHLSPELVQELRDALKAEPEGEGPALDHANLIDFAFGREPWATWLRKGGCLESAHCELSDLMLAAITRWGTATAPPTPETPAEALAARSLLEQVAAMADCIGANTVGQITEISNRAAAWLRDNPPGQPVAIEPTPPAPEPGEVQPPHPTFLDAIRLAQGCHDYSGGHSGQQGEAFQDGVGTVVAVLKKAAVGPWDSQTMAVFGVGSAPQAGEVQS